MEYEGTDDEDMIKYERKKSHKKIQEKKRNKQNALVPEEGDDRRKGKKVPNWKGKEIPDGKGKETPKGKGKGRRGKS